MRMPGRGSELAPRNGGVAAAASPPQSIHTTPSCAGKAPQAAAGTCACTGTGAAGEAGSCARLSPRGLRAANEPSPRWPPRIASASTSRSSRPHTAGTRPFTADTVSFGDEAAPPPPPAPVGGATSPPPLPPPPPQFNGLVGLGGIRGLGCTMGFGGMEDDDVLDMAPFQFNYLNHALAGATAGIEPHWRARQQAGSWEPDAVALAVKARQVGRGKSGAGPPPRRARPITPRASPRAGAMGRATAHMVPQEPPPAAVLRTSVHSSAFQTRATRRAAGSRIMTSPRQPSSASAMAGQRSPREPLPVALISSPRRPATAADLYRWAMI
jgi:hypothetical protein